MKKTLLALLLAVVSFALHADMWRGLTDSNWYSGPKLTEKDLVGKVVVVDKWGVNCPPCRALLPKIQKLWDSFKNKNFMLIASHCQGRNDAKVAELVKANKLTFPIYEGVGLTVNEPIARGIPFLYVVDHRGKVVYSGHDSNAAITALTEALMAINLPPSLVSGLTIDSKSPYKALLKQVALGKPVAPVIKKLENDVKKGEKSKATQAQKDAATAAQEILSAIEEGKKLVLAEIEAKKTTNPVDAIKYIELYAKSFPKDNEAIELKAQLPELRKTAKVWLAEQKAKAAEEKKKAK